MGKMSRNKGRREEQQLVLHLANIKFKAERILRQYQEAGQPDVKAWRSGQPEKVWTFEMKSRQASFKRIYDLYYKEKVPSPSVLACSVGGKLFAMTADFELLMKVPDYFRDILDTHPEYKTFKRILKLEELKQSADILVIRDNGKSRLFIRYW